MIKFYDRTKIDKDKLMFPNKALWVLLVPLVIEQLLNSFMGMADTMMVSRVGSYAISAVSLVDSINILVIQVFAALATGGTIICSQYIGAQNKKGTNQAARQIVISVTAISVVLALLGILFRKPLLGLIFGNVEQAVMDSSQVYFLVTVLSYPFIALFSAGSAFYRAEGNSRFPMKISIISNLLNIAGNAIFIFGFNMGVLGAALATLVSRIFSMVVIFYFLSKPRQIIVLNDYRSMRPDFPLIWKILAIGIPSGIENGMFQFGKLAIQSTVSTLGTAAIAAQAMTLMLENVNGVGGIAIGIGLMTIVGQCVGAGKREEAKYYIVKLCLIAEVVITLSCLGAFALAKPVMWMANTDPKSAELCFQMMVAITIVKPLIWVPSFIPPYGMRAAGDVKFSMLISTCTMWFCRVALAVYLIRFQGFGPMAVWIGMFTDWFVRSILFLIRYLSGKWEKKRVI